MKNRIVIMAEAAAAVIVVVAVLWYVAGSLSERNRAAMKAAEAGPVYGEGYVSDGGEAWTGEDGYTPEELAGDAGITDEEELTLESSIDPAVERPTRGAMISFVREYLGYIPFMDGGRFYGGGYFKAPDGVDNRGENRFGMDSLGYVIWVYRNVFGGCPEYFAEPQSWDECMERVEDVSGLLTGDIGVYRDTATGKAHYGIFLGYDRGVPVFAHCSGETADKYPCGHDRLSYLKASSDAYYMGNAPVRFDVFYRPDMPWEDEE